MQGTRVEQCRLRSAAAQGLQAKVGRQQLCTTFRPTLLRGRRVGSSNFDVSSEHAEKIYINMCDRRVELTNRITAVYKRTKLLLCTTLFAVRSQRLDIALPNAYTNRQTRTECAGKDAR